MTINSVLFWLLFISAILLWLCIVSISLYFVLDIWANARLNRTLPAYHASRKLTPEKKKRRIHT